MYCCDRRLQQKIMKTNSNLEMTSTIISAYRAAVCALGPCNTDKYRAGRAELIMGGRVFSRVDEVCDFQDVESLFVKLVVAGYIKPAAIDRYGNMVHMFRLPDELIGKAHSSFVRISDVVEMGPLYKKHISIGEDWNPITDVTTIRLQAPLIRSLPVNIVTVVLTADNKEFIKWFTGEPRKTYSQSTCFEIIDISTGEIDHGSDQIELGVDYDALTLRNKQQVAKRNHPQKSRVYPQRNGYNVHISGKQPDAANNNKQ